jgi:hypothetical protein
MERRLFLSSTDKVYVLELAASISAIAGLIGITPPVNRKRGNKKMIMRAV